MDPADPASDWPRDRLSDRKCLEIAILSFSTGKIAAILLFYTSFYGTLSLNLQLTNFLIYIWCMNNLNSDKMLPRELHIVR